MKRFFTLAAAIIMVALTSVSFEARASHAVGMDITYTYVGPNQYLITARFYRDCGGITAPTSLSINYTSSCFTGGNITLPAIPGTGLEIPPSPCLPAVTSTCNGGTGYGVQEWVYQALVTLPGPCTDWHFTHDLCCRNGLITTVQNPSGESEVVSTYLDNFNAPTNSSPVFTSLPVTQFCVGNTFYYNQGATDPDGDSLVFSLVPALGAGGTPLTYIPPYSAVTPVASSSPITIDPVTGTISFTPSMVQVGIIDVLVEEYRNGIKIGEVRRDIQMNIVSGCIGSAPAFADPVDPTGNPDSVYHSACGDTSFYLVLDNPIQCGSVVPTDIRVVTPSGQLNPVLSATPINCVNGQTDSILVTVFYPLTAGVTYAFTKVGFDGNTFLSECGVQMPEFDSIPYLVVDTSGFPIEYLNIGCSINQFTLNFNYEIICNTLTQSGSEFVLIDANGTTFPISSISNCPGGNGYSNTLTFDLGNYISPASPLYLIVQNGTDNNTFTNRCNTYVGNGDTLAVMTVLNNLIVSLGADQTVCDVDPTPVLDAGLSGATYSWTFNGTPLPDNTQTIQAPVSGIYTVTVQATPSCSGTDTVIVTVNPSPVVNLGSDLNICSTDPIPPLNSGIVGAQSYTWSLNGVVIPGATGQFYQPSGAGSYSCTVSTGGSCVGTDTVQLQILNQLVIDLGVDQTICSNDPFPVLDAGVPNGVYTWTLNGAAFGGNTQSVQTNAPGTYAVQVTTISGCTAADNFNLTVVAAPAVTLTNEDVCPGTAFSVLDAGAGFSSYAWSNGATTQTITPTAPGSYTVTVTNTGGTVNCSASASALLNQYPAVTVNIGNDQTICADGTPVAFDAGNPGATYQWSNGATTQTVVPDLPGTYAVTVTDGNGCTGSSQATLTVNPLPVVNLGVDFTFCTDIGDTAIDAGNSGSSFVWTYNGQPAGNNQSVTVSNGAYGTYMVEVTDVNGCRSTDEITVTEVCDVTIPTVFTPDNDGINDLFEILNIQSNPNSKLVVYNRWGNEVYSSDHYENDANWWTGKDSPEGTYFYVLVLQNGKNYSGTITLLRKNK
ncbi:MAG TPA: gliding motility-associated C-terminal domain-containing protein [Bacteroidia bacterium]|nr:gliding motility-associated C-terminal domain-containing protein [Bacteroidia bacterium]